MLGTEEGALAAAIRRLHFECYTCTMSDLQSRAAPTEDVGRLRPLPAPERAARLRELQGLLTGLDIPGDLEPGDSLVDKFVTMQENGSLE